MESTSGYLEGIVFNRVINRLKSLIEYKEEIAKDSDSSTMLWKLVNNTGEEDVFLIPHKKEYTTSPLYWDRLPVEIDRTINNIFKTLTYKQNKITETIQVLIANIESINTEETYRRGQERFDAAFRHNRIEERQARLEEDLQNENAMGIYNDEGTLIDVVDRDEYFEYAIAYEEFQRASNSMIDLLRQHVIEKTDALSVYDLNFSPKQTEYIKKELAKNNKFWINFLNKQTRETTICNKCGMEIGDEEKHYCDTSYVHSKVESIFKEISYKNIYTPVPFGVEPFEKDILKKMVIKIPEDY